MKKVCLIIITISFFSFHSFAQLQLPDVISDSMVLQQNTNAPIWGWTNAGDKIEVTGSWSNRTMQTVAGKDGKWIVKLPTPKAGGPYNVTIKATETKTLHGVLIGEVWICSGQSNMEMPVAGWGETTPINNSAQEIANANYPTIRLFIADKKVAFTPQQNVKGKWQSCLPASVAQFSATGYFFGRELFNHLHVPVGLMDVTWGGTIAEAWTSEASLRTMNDFNKDLDRINLTATHADEMVAKDKENEAIWQKALAENNNNNYATDNSDTSWHEMMLPNLWENAGYPDLDGIVWLKKTISIPADWAGKQLKLDLGPVDDNDVTWFNGKIIDSTMKDGSWMADRHYTIPADFVKAGNNVLAVKVIDNGGGGGIYGKKEQLNIYPADGNASAGINLSGNWLFKIAAVKPNTGLGTSPNQPSVLYNGMIAPIAPFAIKGAIWYQGEANVGRAKQYETLFPLLISDWRKQWNEPNFPFYFVQIAPFNYGGDSTQAAALRDAQRRTITASENTGMAVTMDIGNTTNIHPADKQDVGKRLSYWALNKTYGEKNSVYSGPLYKSMEVKDDKVIVSFSNTDKGLTSNNKPLKDFEICGADNIWKPATAKIDGDKIIVQSSDVSKPVAVRYAWYSYAEGSLFNGAGLPASSFTSEALK